MQIFEIKKQIKLQKDLLTWVESAKGVASMRYQEIVRNNAEFYEHLGKIRDFGGFLTRFGDSHPFVQTQSTNPCYIVVTSDMGFMRGLNNKVLEKYYELKNTEPDAAAIVIGEKGADVLREHGEKFKFFSDFPADDLALKNKAAEVQKYISEELMEKRIGRIGVVSAASLSFASQEIRVAKILPCDALVKDSEESWEDKRRAVIESDYQTLVNKFLDYWVGFSLEDIFKGSKLAEYSARAIHFEMSDQNLRASLKKLEYEYNQEKKALINKQLQEINSAKKVKELRELKAKKFREARRKEQEAELKEELEKEASQEPSSLENAVA